MDASVRPSSWWLRAVCAAALIPFAWSLVVHASGVKRTPVAADPNREGLAFEQYLVSLGSPPPRAEYLARFAFRNIGSQPLKISELKPSCGCLNPRLERKEFAPGEGGEFFLRVRAANEAPGPHEYSCQILYDDGQPRETEVRFKITLPEERVEIRPRSLLIYQFNDQPTTKEIVITDFRAAPDGRPLARLEVLEATCSLDWVEVAIGEGQLDENGQRQQKLIVTMSEVPPGVHNGSILVRTNILDYPELRVPLRVEGIPPIRDSAPRKPTSRRPNGNESARDSQQERQ